MTNGNDERKHSELVSGIWIASGRIKHGSPDRIGRGTLTGIALDLSSHRKVLVTNLHVMAGAQPKGDYKVPDGWEQIYQPDIPGDRLVGVRPDYEQMSDIN